MKKFPIILGKLFYSAINLLFFLCEVIESNKTVELNIQNIPNIKNSTLSKHLETYESNLFCYRKIIVFYFLQTILIIRARYLRKLFKNKQGKNQWYNALFQKDVHKQTEEVCYYNYIYCRTRVNMNYW